MSMRGAGNGCRGNAAGTTRMKKKTRRQILKLFCLLPLTSVRPPVQSQRLESLIGNEFVLLDGWVLKKTDLARLLR